MQIRTTLSVQNLHLLPARIGSFRRRLSPLNPSTRQSKPTSCSIATHHQPLESVISTKKHLLNLENFLQKQSHDHVNQLDRPVLQYDGEVARNDTDGSSLAIKGKTLLQGLARMWPEMKAAEEVSPRHLNRLQRLLSMTQQYSPKNHLGSRWSEYHGSNDWKGLLDPLDENLRREVVRYGEFVQAAYHAFHSNPAMSTKEAPLPEHVALPDRSYKVTKSLYATSSVGLPKWVDDVAPDLGWMTQRTGWVGYVAVCDDIREIQRMGRRDIVISLRGTATCLEWAENMRAHLVDVPESHDQTDDPTSEQAKVECGFLSLYKTSGVHVPSLAETVAEEIKRLMEAYKGETLSITVTGHSLGAALALLVANDLGALAPTIPPIAVFSFGGPKVGNRAFTNQLNAKNVKVLRIVNNQDVITRVPCLPMVEDLNVYSHAGVELCVDTKMSPYLKPNADVACCHDLEAYLHLVDGFIASNCPFRANAKRSLVKLLHDQRSNMKKLYTSKARAMSLSFRRHGLSNSDCLPSPSH